MNYLTRYYSILSQLFNFVNKKFIKLKNNFLSFLLLLFIGFFIGNLFGTLVESIRQFNIADSFLILSLITINELINALVYRRYQKKTNTDTKKYNLLNAFKIGVLLGFFIDSFKVGS